LKVFDRGYWVSKIFFFQSLIYYFCYSIRFKSLLFFSASNPSIEFGGMLDDKKSDVYKYLPEHYYPNTFLVNELKQITELIEEGKLSFPFILKPDVGYKGHLVEKIESKKHLDNTFVRYQGQDIIAQEYIALEREYSLMFYKYPLTRKYGISSLIEKSYPAIKGDGISTIRSLITELNNPFVDKANLLQHASEEYLNFIPREGELIIIEKIGNYSRGAKFHSRMELINDDMIKVVNELFGSIHGMNFFRIDFKANSLSDFQSKEFKILEINGAKSEPLHIYDRVFSFWNIIRDTHKHWMIMIDIVKEERKKDYHFPSTKMGWESFRIAKKIGK